jgi:hypothetical protein
MSLIDPKTRMIAPPHLSFAGQKLRDRRQRALRKGCAFSPNEAIALVLRDHSFFNGDSAF